MVERLQRLAQFFALFCLPAWLSATFASEAHKTKSDLRLYQSLHYHSIDKLVAKAALSNMYRHLRCFEPELAIFSLVYQMLYVTTKSVMASEKSGLDRAVDTDN